MVGKKHVLFILAFSITLICTAQDIHFTQFQLQPLVSNPALSGSFVGNEQLSIISRQQWGQVGEPIQTNGIGIEKKFRLKEEFFSAGVLVLRDQLKPINLLTSKAYASITYLKSVPSGVMHLGIQPGYVSRSTDVQSFPDWYNSFTGSFDSPSGTVESNNQINVQYFDLNIGITYRLALKKNMKTTLGFSMAHLSRPKINGYDQEARLPIQYISHASLDIPIGKDWQFTPAFQWITQAQASNLLTLMNLKRYVNHEFSLFMGMGLRGNYAKNDALTFSVGGGTRYVNANLTYDFNISELSQYISQKSTIEFGLQFRTPPKKYRPKKILKYLPCPGENFFDPY